MMASFSGKMDAFLREYEGLKTVENEEAFTKEFMVSETAAQNPWPWVRVQDEGSRTLTCSS